MDCTRELARHNNLVRQILTAQKDVDERPINFFYRNYTVRCVKHIAINHSYRSPALAKDSASSSQSTSCQGSTTRSRGESSRCTCWRSEPKRKHKPRIEHIGDGRVGGIKP